jgi:3',5'-cyclic AMP phosphodiesterase CpdA
MKVRFTQSTPQITTPFPYVRLRRNVALIGLSTAVPQPLHRASGILGPTQLDALEILLNDLRERGFARVVMIHHPPLPGLASSRKALIDAGQLRNVLEAQGAELVLHGHNHEHMQTRSRPASAPSTFLAFRQPRWCRTTITRWPAGTSTASSAPTAAGPPT